MRILHTSDWHLGRTLHGESLHDAHAAFFDHLVEVVESEGVDAIVVSGDVYDRAVPPVTSVELLGDALQRLTERVPVVMTPGNHDSALRLGFAARLFRDRLAVRATVADVGTPVVLPAIDGSDGVLVYALPYLDPDMTRHRLAGPETDADGELVVPGRSHEAVMSAAMRRVETDLSARRARARVPALAMAHAFVVGGDPSDSERDIRIGGVDSVPHGVFGSGPDTVDYVALGHLHGPQRVGPERELGRVDAGPLLRYSGSPLAYSFSEMHHHKASTIVDVGASGVTRVEQVSTPVPRRVGEVKGTLDELEGAAFDDRVDDWLRVIVTGERRPDQLVTRVRDRFPHMLITQFEHTGAQPIAKGPAADVTDPLDVLRGFVHDVTGTAATEGEAEVLREAYEAVLAQGRSA